MIEQLTAALTCAGCSSLGQEVVLLLLQATTAASQQGADSAGGIIHPVTEEQERDPARGCQR